MATFITLEELLAQTNKKTIRFQTALAAYTGVIACVDFFKPLYLASAAEAATTVGLVYNVVQRTKKKYENTKGLIVAMMGLSGMGIQNMYTGIAEKRYAQILVGITEMALGYAVWRAKMVQ